MEKLQKIFNFSKDWPRPLTRQPTMTSVARNPTVSNPLILVPAEKGYGISGKFTDVLYLLLSIYFIQACLGTVVSTLQPKRTDGSMVAETGWRNLADCLNLLSHIIIHSMHRHLQYNSLLSFLESIKFSK